MTDRRDSNSSAESSSSSSSDSGSKYIAITSLTVPLSLSTRPAFKKGPLSQSGKDLRKVVSASALPGSKLFSIISPLDNKEYFFS